MIFPGDRDALRSMYADAWARRLDGSLLSPLEQQIVGVIEEHPEYHEQLGRTALSREYPPEDGASNPFLHMGLHLGLRDQVATDRPRGIRQVFERLAARFGDRHAAEHAMIECLAEALWESQRNNRPPDEQTYLEKLRRL